MWFNRFSRLFASLSSKSFDGAHVHPAKPTRNSRRRACLMSIEQLEVRTVPSTTLTVYSLSGSAAYSLGDGSLRGEIAAASPGDTIQFNSILAGGTINLTGGELTIYKNLTITGPTDSSGHPTVTISGDSSNRIFDIQGRNRWGERSDQ